MLFTYCYCISYYIHEYTMFKITSETAETSSIIAFVQHCGRSHNSKYGLFFLMIGITRKLSWVILLQLDKEVVSLFIHKRCWSLCSTFPRVLNTNRRQWVGETSPRKCNHLALMLLHLVVKGHILKFLVFLPYFIYFSICWLQKQAHFAMSLQAPDVWCFTRWNTWQFLLWCHLAKTSEVSTACLCLDVSQLLN